MGAWILTASSSAFQPHDDELSRTLRQRNASSSRTVFPLARRNLPRVRFRARMLALGKPGNFCKPFRIRRSNAPIRFKLLDSAPTWPLRYQDAPLAKQGVLRACAEGSEFRRGFHVFADIEIR
jgi:hypothetical protein